MWGGAVRDKVEFEKQYKFSIVFDNAKNGIVQDDKIGMGFAAKTIPIYWGNPNITKIYNEKAFINCHAFNSFEQVIERIKEIDQNDELYMKMLAEPAFVEEISMQEWDDRILRFFEHIFTQPKEEAIKRRNEYWSGIMQKLRIEGWERLYRRRKVLKASKKVLSAMYRPFRGSQVGEKMKTIIYEVRRKVRA